MTGAQVIIGDEILAAKVDDENSRFLCSELRAIGWKVRKVRLHAQLWVQLFTFVMILVRLVSSGTKNAQGRSQEGHLR